MLGLKGLVNKLGEHFFKEYKGNKQSDLDIYGFLKKIYGKNIKLSDEKTTYDDFNDNSLYCEERNYVISSGEKPISVSYIIKDMNTNDVSLEEIFETDELIDSEDVVRIVIIKGEDEGQIMTSRFELENDGFKYKISNCDNL